MTNGEFVSFTSYVVDPDRRFQEAIKRAKLVTQDLTIPLSLISKDWFKTNRVIFNLKGPGRYADLKEKTKQQKQKRTGFVYPILEATGRLSASITQPTDGSAISEIINKSSLVLGTKVPYAGYLQFGTKNMPARPMVFFGPESREWGTDKTFQIRTTQWLNILNSYILEKLGASGS
jgi:phage gpG-like protein